MSTMIMRIDVEATLGEKTGEGAVAAGVLAKPVVDLYDAQRSSRGGLNILSVVAVWNGTLLPEDV